MKTKSGERMEHFKEEKDFMQSLVKVFSWRYRMDKLNKQSLDEDFVISRIIKSISVEQEARLIRHLLRP